MEAESVVTKFGYVAKKPDVKGEIGFSITENETWNTLYKRQIDLIHTHAFSQYIEGVKTLNFNSNGVPRLSEINKVLLNPEYAAFSQRIGRLGKVMSKENQKYLARIYWFTIETGLISSSEGVKVYGGSTLSSYSEYRYATTSDLPLRLPFNLLDVLRMPYRVDVLPNVYFSLTGFEQLREITEEKIKVGIDHAKKLGDFRSLYPNNKLNKSA